MSDQFIPVLSAPLLDPGAGRKDMRMAAGMTIGEIVKQAYPEASFSELNRLRVTLVTEAGHSVVNQQYWGQVKPRPGVRVVLRIIPGKDILRSVLQIVVSIAAVALGQYWAVSVLGLQGVSAGIAAGLIGAGLSVLGSLIINALIPPSKPSSADTERRDVYQISGWKNRLDPNGVFPNVTGKLRYAPPFGAMSYTEIVGDVQYIRAVFCFGYGDDHGVSLSGFQIGDTALSDFKDVQTEVREGLLTDAPLSLYPTQVIEESIGAELTRPVPRDSQGNVISGSATEVPVIRYTGFDAAGASVIVGFPAGLGEVDTKGNYQTLTCLIRIRYRPVGSTGGWTTAETLNITSSKFEGFYRQYTWNFATRGRYEVEVTRMTDETTSSQQQSRSSWLALQTLRPEYPLNFGKPLALVAVRVKATYQLNGALDNFNALVARRCKDWDAATHAWVVRETSNPASLFRYWLQCDANPQPASDDEIDLELLQGWHEFCTSKNLKYDAVHEDEDKQLRDVLTEIAGAGRASPRHDGVKWGVVIDRPQDLVVDHINPRNSWQFKSTRTYIKPPHAFRVQFRDATNDYKPAERIVPWPGHSGPITLTEQLPLPGKTDPNEVWIEARRRMYEVEYRLDTYTCMQDGAARTATRGDLVMLNTDVLERMQSAARVKSINGRLIELDDMVTMLADRSYAIRFRVFADGDTVGESVLRSVITRPGTSYVVTLSEAAGDQLPGIDDIVHFGPSASESLPVIVTRVEAGEDFSQAFRMVDAAPIIDELTDEEVPPPWSGRVGDDIGDNTGAPPVPKVTSIRTGLTGAGIAGAFTVLVEPGEGAIVSQKFRLQHRISGAGAWTDVDFPASNGGKTVEGYATGNLVDIRVLAISPTGVPGAPTTPVTVMIGANDAGLPVALDSSMVTIGAMPGGAVIMFSTRDDVATKQIQLYRSTSSTLNRATDAVGNPYDVSPSRSYSLPDGDTTRENLLANPNFDSDTVWTKGAGWTIAAGKASHGGSASDLSQAVPFVAGKYYRIAYTVSDLTAGTLTPRLTSGTTLAGTAQTANGNFSDRLQAVSGNDTFAFRGSAAFDGSVDVALLFEETATCLPAGTHFYWLEPLNEDGVAGPAAGPFSVTIR